MAQEEDAIKRQFDSALNALHKLEFEALANTLHPDTLRFFRLRMGAEYEKLSKNYPDDIVKSIVGVNGNPKTSTLSDKQLFVTTCRNAIKLTPNFIITAPVVVTHGIVRNDEGRAFIVYQGSDKKAPEEWSYQIAPPKVCVFLKHKDVWLMETSFLADMVPMLWKRVVARLPKQN